MPYRESLHRPLDSGRFVVLLHEMPPGSGDHWDFMLESEGGLATWALESEPATSRAGSPGPIAATPLALHRSNYLTYEGPISSGRGNVTRWDEGRFETLAYDDNHLEVRLAGNHLRGIALLTRTSAATDKEIGSHNDAQRTSFAFAFTCAEC